MLVEFVMRYVLFMFFVLCDGMVHVKLLLDGACMCDMSLVYTYTRENGFIHRSHSLFEQTIHPHYYINL